MRQMDASCSWCTVVHCHNWLGRMYLATIAPFHRVIAAGEFGTGGKGDGGLDRFDGDAEDRRGYPHQVRGRSSGLGESMTVGPLVLW